MTTPDITATLLASGPCARDSAPYARLELTGPDAAQFLQRLCTQDVLGLGEGQLAPAAFLDAKGKVQETVLVARCGDVFVLETRADRRASLLALLDRYHFTEKLAMVPVDDGSCHEWVAAADGPTAEAMRTDDGFQVRFARRGILFVRSYGSVTRVDATPLDEACAEALRMCSGLVWVGVETEPSTLALEADLDDHCSTRKGCYTGQEIVARIHTYGKVNRKLCLLQLGPGAPITAPATLLEPEDDLPVGRVLHAVMVDDVGRIGLGYLPADFQAIGTKLRLDGGGAVEVVGFG
ncbi:MAG TPA: folate-binding protein [bacterium]|nr:folate-binding protein [bacterium]